MNTVDTNIKRSAIRFLIDYPEKGWQLYPLNKAQLVYQGKQGIIEFANQSIRVSYAHIEIDKANHIELKRLEFLGWQMNAEGYVDQDADMREITENINPAVGKVDYTFLSSVLVTDSDIAAIKQCLGVN